MKTTDWKLQQFSTGAKHKCWHCKCHLTYEIATVDHLRPRAMGGPDKPYNYRLACNRCNQGRDSKPLSRAERRLIYAPGEGL